MKVAQGGFILGPGVKFSAGDLFTVEMSAYELAAFK